MAEEKMNIPTEGENEVEIVEASDAKVEKVKKVKNGEKKPNFFVRTWKKLLKLCKDTAGELKKVVWTPKAEVKKSFILVIATVVGVSVVIAIIDFASSWIINSIAGLIG